MSLFGRPTYGNGRRANPMKWIIAAIIAGIGIITYLRSGQVNPVTGEKQYVAMNVDQEKALGLQAAPQMAKGKLGQMLAGAAGVASSDRGGGGAMAAQMVNQMMQLKYSRTDELQADNFGLKYMSEAGYDPREMLRVMQILKQASGGG